MLWQEFWQPYSTQICKQILHSVKKLPLQPEQLLLLFSSLSAAETTPAFLKKRIHRDSKVLTAHQGQSFFLVLSDFFIYICIIYFLEDYIYLFSPLKLFQLGQKLAVYAFNETVTFSSKNPPCLAWCLDCHHEQPHKELSTYFLLLFWHSSCLEPSQSHPNQLCWLLG